MSKFDSKEYMWFDQFLRARKAGATVVQAAAFVGVSRNTVYEAFKRIPTFKHDDLLAQDEASIKLGPPTKRQVPYAHWPRHDHLRAAAELTCIYCGDPIEVNTVYHSNSTKQVHHWCADRQTHYYEELQALLRGDQ